jgi:hypothetical protein
MARFNVAIFKRLTVGTVFTPWSNVYQVEAASALDALDIGEDIVEIEKAVHKDYVQYTKMTATEDIDDPPVGSSRVLTATGDITGVENQRLPGFNAVRVILSDGNGRPSQKYLRPLLEEDDIADGSITTATRNLFSLSYAGPLIGLAGVVSNSGDTFISATVQDAIQMRQQSWHRRTRPGFHRGYVPD